LEDRDEKRRWFGVFEIGKKYHTRGDDIGHATPVRLSYGGTVSLKKECHQHPHE
jgi:hypothetical protein